MKLGIIGLGLIGGSLGLALRSRDYYVIGISRHQETCQLARQKGMVDQASVDFSLLSEAAVIFICTPIEAILPTVQQLQPILSPDTIVTDVGSVKAPVVDTVTPLWSNFIGGHPMAGTAQQGIEAAQTDLFPGTRYILTPTENTPSQAQKTVSEIVQSLETEVMICSPQIHDQAVALISHLPVFVSSSLIATCAHQTDTDVLNLAQKLASSGFRDTTRVGGGNPELGLMMAKYNKTAVQQALLMYRQQLDAMINTIEQENWDQLEMMLGQTQGARSRFL